MNRLKLFSKLSIRYIFSNLKSSLFLGLSMLLIFCILFNSFIFKGIVKESLENDSKNFAGKSDVVMSVDVMTGSKFFSIRNLKNVLENEQFFDYFSIYSLIGKDNVDTYAQFFGGDFEKLEKQFGLRIEEKNVNGVVISQSLAEKLKVKKNDYLLTKLGNDYYSLKVLEITKPLFGENEYNHKIFVDKKLILKSLELGDSFNNISNVVFIETQNPAKLISKIKNIEEYKDLKLENIVGNEELKSILNSINSPFQMVIFCLLIFSILFLMIFVFQKYKKLENTIIKMKELGMMKKEIFYIFSLEILIIAMLFSVIGFFISPFIIKLLLYNIVEISYTLKPVLSVLIFLIISLLSLIVLIIAIVNKKNTSKNKYPKQKIFIVLLILCIVLSFLSRQYQLHYLSFINIILLVFMMVIFSSIILKIIMKIFEKKRVFAKIMLRNSFYSKTVSLVTLSLFFCVLVSICGMTISSFFDEKQNYKDYEIVIDGINGESEMKKAYESLINQADVLKIDKIFKGKISFQTEKFSFFSIDNDNLGFLNVKNDLISSLTQDEIILSQYFYDKYGLKSGDSLNFMINGQALYLKIVGTFACSLEFGKVAILNREYLTEKLSLLDYNMLLIDSKENALPAIQKNVSNGNFRIISFKEFNKSTYSYHSKYLSVIYLFISIIAFSTLLLGFICLKNLISFNDRIFNQMSVLGLNKKNQLKMSFFSQFFVVFIGIVTSCIFMYFVLQELDMAFIYFNYANDSFYIFRK